MKYCQLVLVGVHLLIEISFNFLQPLSAHLLYSLKEIVSFFCISVRDVNGLLDSRKHQIVLLQRSVQIPQLSSACLVIPSCILCHSGGYLEMSLKLDTFLPELFLFLLFLYLFLSQ
jgi:hypothetical protein